LPNKKLAGLLAYLACSGSSPQPREKLSALLWGSHFDTQAKQNLRQAVFRLRKLVGQDTLISTSELVGLNSGSLSCDVVELQSLAKGERGTHSQLQPISIRIASSRMLPFPRRPGTSGFPASASGWSRLRSVPSSACRSWSWWLGALKKH
jgi:hypothetical protein